MELEMIDLQCVNGGEIWELRTITSAQDETKYGFLHKARRQNYSM